MRPPPWHIITGEYAPAHGGVAAYARCTARALADAGDEVHVWAPPTHGALVEDPGVHVHSIPPGFGARSVAALSAGLDRRPGRVLVQYVPNAFGAKGMNIPFCAWIASLRAIEVWIMFHEVAVPPGPLRAWKQNVVAFATKVMARLLVMRADRVLVSIPGWIPILQSLAPRWRPEATWMPIPSNVPTTAPPSAAGAIRERLRIPEAAVVIGHFGTFGPLVTPSVKRVFLGLLRRDPRRVALAIGHWSDRFAEALQAELGGPPRAFGTGSLASGEEIAAHLLACDVLVQPFGDGITTRRTSAMAGLALGRPMATNAGPLTEPLWREERAVQLARSVDGVTEAAERLLADPAHAARVGARAAALYAREFSLERTVRALRDPARPARAGVT